MSESKETVWILRHGPGDLHPGQQILDAVYKTKKAAKAAMLKEIGRIEKMNGIPRHWQVPENPNAYTNGFDWMDIEEHELKD